MGLKALDPGVLAVPGTPMDLRSHVLPPKWAPSHHLGHQDWDPAQNPGPDLAMGILGPESQCSLLTMSDPQIQGPDFEH